MIFMAESVAIGYRLMQAKFVPQKYNSSANNNAMKNSGFPDRLREACEDAGLSATQPALARAFSLSTTTIWHYLNGEKLPSMSTAILIAGKLGVCVEWLLTGNGPKRVKDVLDISQFPDPIKVSVKMLLDSVAAQKLPEKSARV
jgi:transcriptional regulator with XRE-family HTH domain